MISTLREMSECYRKKKPSDITGLIHISIGDEEYLVRLDEEDVQVEKAGKDRQADLGLVMSEKTFEDLRSGKWNGMTATGRASMSESAPLDFRVPDGEGMDGENLQLLYHFLTHFFSGGYPTVTDLGREHSRKIHGGNAVPIAYGHGVRYAYYTISQGEQINEDESDPWDQVFTVINGTGTAVIDGEEIELEKDMAVHVPPKLRHVVKNERGDDDLELLWMAYGEDA